MSHLMLRRLDRYLIAEILGPLALGFLIYTFMLLFRVLFRMAELIIRSSVSVETVGKLLLLSLPNIVVLTIPMSFLFAILIAVGRLSSDSELIAIRASGISLFSLYRPILVLSAILTGLNIYLMLELLPQGNYAFQQLDLEIKTQGLALTQAVQPRVPHTSWDDQMLYVFESPPGERRWKGAFFTEAIPSGEMEVRIAEWGEARNHPETSEVMLTLTNMQMHTVDLDNPEKYNIGVHSDFSMAVGSGQPTPGQLGSVKRGLRELPFQELVLISKDPKQTPLTRTMAEVEIHKKFSFPFACIVFGLLGLPLGFTNARGGRSSGFAISIAVVMVYYIVFNWGEDFAKKGLGPTWLAVWLPNIVLLAVGLFLLVRRNRDKSLLLSRVDKWIQEHLWRHLLLLRQRREVRQKKRQEILATRRSGRGKHVGDEDQVVLRLPDFRLPFPTLIDRYILSSFLRVLGVVTCSTLAIYIIADLTENAGHILTNDAPYSIVLDYYKYKSFAIIYQISPIIVLITTLISFGVLSRTNEITALKALGLSLYRLAMPVVLAGLILSGLCAVLQTEILAASNERVADLKAQIKGEAPSRRQRADQRWLYGKQGGYLYNYGHYDSESQEIQRLQIFQFDEEYRLIRRLAAAKASYLSGGDWRLVDGWAREFGGNAVTSVNMIDEPMKMNLPEPPEFFEGVQRSPEEMHFTELSEYIQDLRAFGGEDIAPLEVELHNKIAYPVLVLVMTLVALPFSFRLGRQGALYGIGLSLVLGIVLLIFQGFFQAMGKAAILPAAVATWSPGVIFSIFALYLFLGVRT